jgi:hypothetical protein
VGDGNGIMAIVDGLETNLGYKEYILIERVDGQ